MMRVVWEFTKREARRFLRQKGRLIATLATPIVFWVMVGHGFGSLLEETFLQTNSLHFFFPGILLMTVLFSSIFSMISLVEDRNEGFLQGVRLVPQAAIKIVLGKVSATSFLALLQTLLVVLLAPLIGVKLKCCNSR
ncbi:MAG: ABC transporter permease [Bdellovibrionota bacterium]